MIINSAAINPGFIESAAKEFGSSTISVCIDYQKKLFGGIKSWIHAGTKSTQYTPLEFALNMQNSGAGEIIMQSIERDGTMTGYDLEMLKSISQAVTIPVIALGGAADLKNLSTAYKETHVNGLAAGSLFVYQGANHGVTINYPDRLEKEIIYT